MQITPSHHPILNSSRMMKLYFWIHGFFYKSGCRVVRVADTAVMMAADVAVLMHVHMSGRVAALLAAHKPGDAAPSYALSGLQPEMPDCGTSLDRQINRSGQRPGTSQIGAAPLYTRTNKY